MTRATLAEWTHTLAGLPESDAATLVAELHDSWLEGRLDDAVAWPDDPTPSERDRRFGRFFLELPPSLGAALFRFGSAESEADVRRWCWAPGWTLMEQDEWGEPIARRIYAETRAGYHAVTQGSVDEVVSAGG